MFTGVKVFSATMVEHRATLGDRVSVWLDERRRVAGFSVVDMVVTQSSDAAFHMIAITVFYREDGKPDASTLLARTRQSIPTVTVAREARARRSYKSDED